MRYFIALLLLVLLPHPALAEGAKDKPLWSQADQYYDKKEMEKARKKELAAMGGLKTAFIMGDRLEWQSGRGEDAFVWDAQGWYGNDDNKLWLKTEGEYGLTAPTIEEGEIQALWSKPISTYWDLQTGLRYDFEPKGRTHLVAGVQGLAPYFFEIDAAGFLDTHGQLTARIEAEYDMFLGQRLVLQPRAEINVSAQDIQDLSLGAGLTGFDLGLRLRYDIKREFAPYVGLSWLGSTGKTARLARQSGQDTNAVKLLVGLRAWY